MFGRMIFKMMTTPSPSTIFTLFLIFLTIHRSIQKSTPASLSYRAAVVEYEPVIYANDSRKTIDENLKQFLNFIDEASSKNVDIVVFPELGITTLEFTKRSDFINFASFVPNSSDNYTPCENSSIVVSPSLKNISSSAKLNSIYVVINIVEKEVCSSPDLKTCPNDGFLFYTTNVAFDRRGKIIARYRKSHGYDEFGAFDKPEFEEISTIETDFGITFGNAMSLDIVNEEPGLTLTKKFALNDVVYPTVWYSKMPFITAIQIQAGWAHAKDVNLLAAGYNRFNRGNFGSGIYAGRQGIVKSTLPLSGNRREMLIAEVMKKAKKPAAISVIENNEKNVIETKIENEYLRNNKIIHDELRRRRDTMILPNLRYEKFEGFETQLVIHGDDGKPGSVQKLNHNDIVCEFRANFTPHLPNPKPIYRYVAFDGASLFDDVQSLFGVKICALVLCANETIESCGRVKSAPEFFSSIEINASFKDPENTLMTPNTLDDNLLPILINKFNFRQLNEEGRALISITIPSQNFITFGIWGRNFAENSANFVSKIFNPTLILASPIFILLSQYIR